MINEDDYEIVGFYPIYGKKGFKLTVSAHVYIAKFDLDIRGWYVHYDYSNENVTIYPPMLEEYDYEQKMLCGFPAIESINGTWLKDVKILLANKIREFVKTYTFAKGFPANYTQFRKLKWPDKNSNIEKPKWKYKAKPHDVIEGPKKPVNIKNATQYRDIKPRNK